MILNTMRACKDFKPFVTNVDLCDHWIRMASVPDGDGSHAIFPTDPFCRKGLACPSLGRRPERLDQESDSEDL